MTLKVLRSARDDLRSGIQFYNRHQKGLGSYFYDTLISDIESLQVYAGIHPQVQKFYRVLSKRFPYSIYYKIENSTIKIYAILDDRRDPKVIQERIEEQK
jgi:plasmid stabilization system protein ParE